MLLKSAIKSVWRGVVPAAIRESAFVQRNKTRILPHGFFYDERYYREDVERLAAKSAPVMIGSLASLAEVETLVDLGCGTGAMLEQAQKVGLTVTGFEYAPEAMKYCVERGLNVTRFNIERDDINAHFSKKFDAAISFEVAEHLPEAIADQYVRCLISLSNLILISAATPGQGGMDHVNEQPNEYWIEKFAANGAFYDAAATNRLRDDWAANDVAWYYAANLLIFRQD